MAGRKETQLPEATFLDGHHLVHITNTDAAVGSQSQKMRKDNFESSLNLSSSNPSQLISGGMQWVSGLTYQSNDQVYEIAGNQFSITD